MTFRPLVWDDRRNEEWIEGRLRLHESDSVTFNGWPKLIVDHALALRALVPDDKSIVLANDQGDVFDLSQISDRDALLEAIDAAGTV